MPLKWVRITISEKMTFFIPNINSNKGNKNKRTLHAGRYRWGCVSRVFYPTLHYRWLTSKTNRYFLLVHQSISPLRVTHSCIWYLALNTRGQDSWRFTYCWNVCMYLMIGRGQIALQRPYWGESRLKSNIFGKYNCLVVFWKQGAPVPMLLQMVNGSST